MNTKPITRKSRYLRIIDRGHVLAHSDGRVYMHRAVLYDKIGLGEHVCHWCGKQVVWNGKGIQNLVVDHLDFDKWNNKPENLVPSCRICNSERAIRADFLTHCENGHEWSNDNIYVRPDGKGRNCRKCAQLREKRRIRCQKKSTKAKKALIKS